MKFLRKLYAPDYMLKPSQKMQDSYVTKDFYLNFFKLAWPAVLESLLLGLVNFVDSIMVSTQGSAAVAAVGLTNQPKLLFWAVYFSIGVGVTAIVSRRKGENDSEDANRCLSQAIMLCILIGAVMLTVGIVFAEPLMKFSGAKSDTLPMAIPYFRIVMVGQFFAGITLIINAAQRGAGNTRISMTTNMTANIVNCIFNALLINGLFFFPKLGVMGAAIATTLGNMVAFFMAVYSVERPGRFLHLKLSSLFLLKPGMILLIFKIASAAAVEQVFMRFGFFSVSKMVAELSTIEFATHTICMNITNLSFCLGDGLGVAASALVGQNLGKRRPDYSIIYGKSAQRIGLCCATGLAVLFVFGGEMLINLFMSKGEPEAEIIVATGVIILRFLAAITFAQISQVLFSGCLRGAGDTKYTATVSLISIALVRPVITYVLCYVCGFGVVGAWIAMLTDQYLRLILMAHRFSGGKWTKIKV